MTENGALNFDESTPELPRNVYVAIAEAMRPDLKKPTQRQKIISLMVERLQRGTVPVTFYRGIIGDYYPMPPWVNASELARRIGYKFHARLTELRKMGFPIQGQKGKNGLMEYRFPDYVLPAMKGGNGDGEDANFQD